MFRPERYKIGIIRELLKLLIGIDQLKIEAGLETKSHDPRTSENGSSLNTIPKDDDLRTGLLCAFWFLKRPDRASLFQVFLQFVAQKVNSYLLLFKVWFS